MPEHLERLMSRLATALAALCLALASPTLAAAMDADGGTPPCSADAGTAGDGGCPAPAAGQSDEDLKRELERSLQQDAAARAQGGAAASGSSPTGQPAAPSDATAQGPTPLYGGTLARGSQSLNPDI